MQHDNPKQPMHYTILYTNYHIRQNFLYNMTKERSLTVDPMHHNYKLTVRNQIENPKPQTHYKLDTQIVKILGIVVIEGRNFKFYKFKVLKKVMQYSIYKGSKRAAMADNILEFNRYLEFF